VVRQMTGAYTCRSPRLYSLNWTCQKLARTLAFSISHISREHNAEANGLANSAARKQDSGESLSGCRGGRGSKWQNRCVPWRRAWRETLGGAAAGYLQVGKNSFVQDADCRGLGGFVSSLERRLDRALPSIGVSTLYIRPPRTLVVSPFCLPRP
jgi:hypothetical protein